MAEKTFTKSPGTPTVDDDVEETVGTTYCINDVQGLEEVPSFWKKVTAIISSTGAETIGVQRLPEAARDPKLKPWSTFTIWTTANFHYAAITTGALGPSLWGLGWWDSFLVIIFFNALGCTLTGLTSTMGPQLGMRAMIVTRYSYGYWFFNRLISLFTAITCVGWVTVNTVAGGNLLLDAWDNKVPLVVIIILIIIASVITCFLGYGFIEKFDRYGWILQFVAMVFLVGFGGNKFTLIPDTTGDSAKLGSLSFGALIFSWSIGWAPLAPDYSSYLSEKTSKKSVFIWTFFGNWVGSSLAFCIGIGLASLLYNDDPVYDFAGLYASGGYGALAGGCFLGYSKGVRNFGRFIQTLLGVGIVGANLPNMYSFALDLQAMSSYTRKVPRAVITVVGAGISLAVALSMRDSVSDTLSNFIDVFSYWITPYTTVIIIDHFFIRKRLIPYDVDAWNDPSKLPVGIAAGFTFLAGFALALCCSDQTWLVGPIADALGADIAFETTFAFVCITYVPLRILEYKMLKR